MAEVPQPVMIDPFAEVNLGQLFTFVPELGDVESPEAWAAAAVEDFYADRDVDAGFAAKAHLVETFSFMVSTPVLPGYDFRVLFMPAPENGGAVYHLAFIDAATVTDDLRDVLAERGEPAPLGRHTDEFAEGGMDGRSTTRFAYLDDSRSSTRWFNKKERPIVATHTVTVRRQLTGRGLTDVVATASSADLEPFLASLPSIRRLLLSSDFDELVTALTSPPSDPS